MRRISLALALVGAVAAAGCSGGAKSSSDAGGNPGVADGFFTVKVTTVGGAVVLTPDVGTAATCAADTTCEPTFALNSVVTVTGDAANMGALLGWAGDCQGWEDCVLSGNADKYVLVSFGDLSKAESHPNWSNGVLHAQMYNTPPQDFPACTKCHGASLQGIGIAPSCSLCHPVPLPKGDPAVGPPHGLASGHNTGNNCSRCHSGGGFRDFIGADGTSANYLATGDYATNAPKTDGVATAFCSDPLLTSQAACVAPAVWTPVTAYANGISCDACHNSATVLGGGTMNKHTFASGNVVTMDGKTAICSQCHDGGRPTYEVSQVKKQLAATPVALSADDQLTATGANKTVRAHFVVAASTLFGSEAAAYYQFPGNIYTARNEHGGKGSCVDCHDAHNGKVKEGPVTCGACHFDELTGFPVKTLTELEESRQYGFEGDIDGGGELVETVKGEIDGLGAKLYAAIQAYAKDVTGTEICYYNNRFYKFTPGSTAACGTTPNNVEFNVYTPRLLIATYNYNMFLQDVGSWAHNPRYVVEILFDTINDVNDGLVAKGKTPVAFSGKRAFNGHFGGAEDVSPYSALVYHSTWGTSDTQGDMGFTQAACYQCHGGKVGLDQFVKGEGLTMAGKVNAFQCSTCHTYGADMKGVRTDVTNIYFPAQKAAAQMTVIPAASLFPKAADRTCATCHTGREGKLSVDAKIGATPADSWTLSFSNPHYLGAAALIPGANAKMLYEYAGKTYHGNSAFFGSPHGSAHGQSCIGCHEPKASKHTFEVELATCNSCHVEAPYGDFRLPPLKVNIEALADLLYTKITAYSQAAGKAVCYADGHPYWFGDTNADGICQTTEAVSTNGAKLNPAALRAAFNFKWAHAEPGAYAHNYEYIAQALIDSIMDLDPAAVLPADAKLATDSVAGNEGPIVRP